MGLFSFSPIFFPLDLPFADREMQVRKSPGVPAQQHRQSCYCCGRARTPLGACSPLPPPQQVALGLPAGVSVPVKMSFADAWAEELADASANPTVQERRTRLTSLGARSIETVEQLARTPTGTLVRALPTLHRRG
jgi:hypothetical protein